MVFDTFPLNCSFILPLANAPVAVPAEVGVERTWRTPTHESDKEQLLQRHARRSTRIRKESYPHFFRSPNIVVNTAFSSHTAGGGRQRGLKQKQILSHFLSTETAGQSTDFSSSAQVKLLQTDFGLMLCAGNVQARNRLRAHNGRIGPQMSLGCIWSAHWTH